MQIKQALRQFLLEESTYNYNVVREVYVLLEGIQDENIQQQLSSLKSRLNDQSSQQQLFKLAQQVIFQYTGKNSLQSSAAKDNAEQIVDLSDVTSVYFDGRDLDDAIVQYHITNDTIVALVKELVDNCDRFAIQAAKVDSKCKNMNTSKIKDQLEQQDLIDEQLEVLWNRIKGVAYTINIKYSYITRLIDCMKRNKIEVNDE